MRTRSHFSKFKGLYEIKGPNLYFDKKIGPLIGQLTVIERYCYQAYHYTICLVNVKALKQNN